MRGQGTAETFREVLLQHWLSARSPWNPVAVTGTSYREAAPRPSGQQPASLRPFHGSRVPALVALGGEAEARGPGLRWSEGGCGEARGLTCFRGGEAGNRLCPAQQLGDLQWGGQTQGREVPANPPRGERDPMGAKGVGELREWRQLALCSH